MHGQDRSAPATDQVESAPQGWTDLDLPLGEPTPALLLGHDEHGRAELIDLTPELEQEAEAVKPGQDRLVKSAPRQPQESES